jgi:crotonobetainyl-CoA:carnitine CoA-transferase CaiB-like acyl-CoA transferase
MPDLGPLDGIRVLDFTHAAAGPYATMFMADMGADVLKVEKPGRGDGARFMGEPLLGEDDSDYYLALNRNKKDILLDLSQPEGVDVARRLAAQSDVVVQNFRPGVMDRLGLGYDDLRSLRPGLIYCSISAFGATGPWSKRPANDIIMQSISGLMGITGEVGGGPVRIGAPISDYSSGLFALAGMLSALLARDRFPEGQHVEVSMLDASIAMSANYIPSVSMLSKRVPRLGRGHAQIVPYQAFVCADGHYVMVGAFTNGFWRRLAEAVEHPEWIDDPKYVNNADRLIHRDELLGHLETIFKEKTRAEWLEILEQADVPNSPVLELDEAIRSEQAIHNETVITVGEGDETVDVVKLPIECAQWKRPDRSLPPPMGRDTKDIMTQLLGFDESMIAALAQKGAVGLAQASGDV